MPFDLDLTNETPESMDAFGVAPAGWYYITLEDVDESEPERMTLHWKISQGPFTGSKVRDWLHDPEFVEESKQGFHRKKAAMYASRLELANGSNAGQIVSFDPARAIGKEVVAELAIRTSDRGEFNEIKMGALYPNLDHPKCPSAAKTALRGDPAPENRNSKSPAHADLPNKRDPLAGL